MSVQGTKRLLIPAQRPVGREVLVPVAPFFLRDPAQVPQGSAPRILSFDTDGFMADFLAVAGGTRDLPRLLPWRDWSEPPEAMLDSTGAKTYPNSIARRPPEPWEIEPEPPAGMDPDGVPRDAAGGPAWLRKLYLPLHERFNLVAFDLVCQAPGWPRLARGRVLESGALIRRLARNTAAETWQDWIALDDKHGAWLTLVAGDRLRPDPTPAPQPGLDPAALTPADVAAPGLAALHALLGAPVGTALPKVALTSQPLTLVPPDAGPAAQHCTLFGYLPVFSAAQEQVGGPLSLRPSGEIVAALSAQTQTALDAQFSRAPALQAQATQHLRDLLDLTLLPDRPANTTDARDEIWKPIPGHSRPADVEAQVALRVDEILRAALHRLLLREGERPGANPTGVPLTVTAAIAGTVSSPQVFWEEAKANEAALDVALSLSPGTGWLRENLSQRFAQWDTLVRERLHQAVNAWVGGTWVPPADPTSGALTTRDLWGLMALAVLRLRICRLALSAYLGRQTGWGLDDDRFTALDRHGDPVCTAAALGEEVRAILGAEDGRGDARTTPPWPAIATSGLNGYARLLAVHQAGERLAEVYTDFDARLAEGGAATLRAIEDRRQEVAADLAATLDTLGRPLRNYGLSLAEQPARALLVVPVWGARTSDLAHFKAQAAALYTAAPESLALPEARAREAAPRLRFDADHLYAAWCWVRVAGHGPCEPARVIWTGRSEPFAIADPTDLLGARPAVVKMPDIPRLLKDLPRLAKAKARPFAAVTAPDRSGVIPGAEMADTQRDWGIGMICNFGIPVLTICAMVLFSIIFSILILIPGFAWMLLLKFCIPFPKRSS